ncbi:MAG: Xylulose kinase [uncultured Acidimicrobiales bacterium]|uniref:Xylulose kinase n=1 Tax=uncultured Acidimicrobiales bacterium TaxID=310071 RepID=A0A6J4IFB0_9ACTN|nr:MAG: Xylulose kinase [uncultured Acidimicrobiales bacterium]
MLVAGVDSSTQATKVVVRDGASGALVRQGRAPHPPGTEVAPEAWWQALGAATQGGLLDDVAAIGVAGQQHGLVVLDDAGEVVRPALLWNDTRSAGAADDLVEELGGGGAWAEAVGTVPVASITVTKLRWLAEHEPDRADRVAQVLLPHDHLTWRLTGRAASPVTDRGDASGTGYWSPSTGRYRPDLLRLAFGRELQVPVVLGPSDVAGTTEAGAVVSVGTGDNMAAALGVGAGPGDVVVSIGTSGTVFAVAERASADPTGIIAGFADATGRYLPLVCTMNAARVLTTVASLLGVDQDRLDELAMSAPPGAAGVVLVPYLDGERTPNLPHATGTFAGLRHETTTPANLARAAVEGVLCGLADGLDALRCAGTAVHRVILIGGGARSRAVQVIAPAVLGVPVVVPDPSEHVADGAARQAAWALSGEQAPPPWVLPAGPASEVDPTPAVRDAYAAARDLAAR